MDWSNTILIVGALGELKVYKVEESQREINNQIKTYYHPVLVTDLDFIDAHKKLKDIVTDEAGRFGHNISEEHELENERKERIIKDAAKVIKMVVEKLEPKNIMLSYTKEYIKKLEDELDSSIKNKIKKIIPVDLIKTPKDKLLEHFE